MPSLPPLDRNDALADPSRRALLAALRRSAGPHDVRDLAAAVGLRPNSAREQLARLAEAGLVRVTTAPPSGRGRPGLRYTAAPTETVDPYRVLVSVLADQLADSPDAATRSEAAGERWGRAAAATLPPTEPGDAIAAVTELMAEAGFAPEVIAGAPGQAGIELHACPFLPMEPRHLDIVCGVHLGFLRGALGELGAPVDAVSIHPFSTPDACSARLETRPDV